MKFVDLKINFIGMDSPCSVCNEAIEDDDDVFECDGCSDSLHLKCGGATKKDISARRVSKCLRVYCKLCVSNPAACVADNVKTIMKFVHKIDLFNQKQVETNARVNDILTSTVEKASRCTLLEFILPREIQRHQI